MKKLISVIMAFILCFSLISCKNNNPKEDKTKVAYYIQNNEDMVYIYEGDTEKYRDWIYFYDFISNDKVQKRLLTSKKATGIEVLTFYKDAMVLTKGIYIDAMSRAGHEDIRYTEDNTDIIMLKEPLKLGNSWIQSKMSEKAAITKITGVDVEVTVPYGTFKALEVTTTYSDSGDSEVVYYAKDIGIIKSVSVIKGEESVSELSEILEKQGLSETIPVFYLNKAKDGIEYAGAEVIYFTNANLPALYLQTAKQFISDRTGVVINDNIKVNTIVKDEAESQITADFNSYALEEINKIQDAQTTELVLQCAANYFGYLYGVESVQITIEGENYKLIDVDTAGAKLAE